MDVSKLCRSCMVEIAAWECEDADPNTMEMFSFCTNIEIPEEDKLPKHFCYNCTVLLESSYAYIRTARRVNGKLKKIVQNGYRNFVDNFLNKANSVEQIVFKESVTVKAEKVDVTSQNLEEHSVGKVTEDISVKKPADINLDDLFDEDDDRCLSEFKSGNVDSEIKTEPEFKEGNESYLQPDTTPSESQSNGVAETAETRPNTCQICKKEFSTEGWLTRHMKMVHADMKKKSLNGMKKKKIRRKKNTVHHETKDTGDPQNEIKCRVCNKVFTSKQTRTKHLNEEHSGKLDGQRVFLCPYCPKTFTKYSHMYYHTTSHPDLAKHPCGTCGKAYRIRKELDQHLRTHLKDRPYACDRCDMRFKLKGCLATHLKWHEGIRPFLCSICGRSFLQSGNLESHMRVHTGERPFACAHCTFRTNSRASLKRHERRHKGDRPYPCTYCPKRFFECSSLNRHLRCHTRERPYRCPYCSREFLDSGKRRRHFIQTHKMAPEEIPAMDKNGASIERTAQNMPQVRSHPWKMAS